VAAATLSLVCRSEATEQDVPKKKIQLSLALQMFLQLPDFKNSFGNLLMTIVQCYRLLTFECHYFHHLVIHAI